MPELTTRRRPARTVAGVMLGFLALVVVLAGGVAAFGTWVLLESRPTLSGHAALAGLSAPVTVNRDANGVPTIDAANRIDLARALGFLHGQERFFQMDLLRRAGAGELSGLVGSAALPLDRRRRLHRFRARAEAVLATQSKDQRAIVAAYTEGVNAGLSALGHAPWEYTLLRVSPAPWTEADTSLVVYAMYFDLQPSNANEQEAAFMTREVLGAPLASFLRPKGTPQDAALDGSLLPEPAIPSAATPPETPAGQSIARRPPEKGSNNFAVAGRRTATGSAMVANDMHLGLSVPNIWYRARLRARDGGLDLIGVTLPGTPFLVVGSNTHVAWGFTDGYIEAGDAVVLEPAQNDTKQYLTPDGPKPIVTTIEKLCPARAPCEDLPVEETIWGPVVSQDAAGHKIVWRWTAHDPNAVLTTGFTRLEAARTIREALDAAHSAGLPQENFVAGDSAGHIAWTIIGQVPRRVGLDDQMPHSWADGTHRWDGYLSPADIPEIIDPPAGKLWTANARAVGGEALAKLGDGGYADARRAGRIRDDLAAREHFAETDFLAIQNDDRATGLDPWQKLLLQAIDANPNDSAAAALRSEVQNWGGRAEPASVGYRLVETFRKAASARVLDSFLMPVAARMGDAQVGRALQPHTDWPVLRLLTERPPNLLPPPFKNWNDVTAALLHDVTNAVQSSGGDLAHFTWGAINHTGIHHPLSPFVPFLSHLTDPPDVPVAGDVIIPRVTRPGFGASERLVVSPGHEASGIFEMPMGQSDNPLSPYYGAGQQAWVAGTPAPLLPGPGTWRLTLEER